MGTENNPPESIFIQYSDREIKYITDDPEKALTAIYNNLPFALTIFIILSQQSAKKTVLAFSSENSVSVNCAEH